METSENHRERLKEEKQWVALLLGEREKSLFEKIDAFERDKSDLTWKDSDESDVYRFT